MTLIVIIAVAVALLLGVVVLATGRAAKREGPLAEELLGLAKVRSPSGKPFFPTDDSALELAELLNDVHERRERESER